MLADAEALVEGDDDVEPDGLALGDFDGEADGELDPELLGEVLVLGLVDAEVLELAEGLALAVALPDADTDGEALSLVEGLAETLVEGDTLGEALALVEGDALSLVLGDADALVEALVEGLALGEALPDSDADGDALALVLGLVEGLALADVLGLAEGLVEGEGLSAANSTVTNNCVTRLALTALRSTTPTSMLFSAATVQGDEVFGSVSNTRAQSTNELVVAKSDALSESVDPLRSLIRVAPLDAPLRICCAYAFTETTAPEIPAAAALIRAAV